MLSTWLAHPLTRGLDIDDPHTTQRRLQIIQEKAFLRRIYEEWYAVIAAALPTGSGQVLELGSGAGFLTQYIPQLISSENFYCEGVKVKLVLDGHRLPFVDNALRGIVMTNVLHHLPQSRCFFSEAERCVRPGGVIAMIEPWVTCWSRTVYTHLHHEPFDPESPIWEFPRTGPLSGANGALPWIVFGRDREQFEREFPMWQVRTVNPFMPFRYLISGGLSLRSLMPGWSFGFWRAWEDALGPLRSTCAMFAFIVLERVLAPTVHQASI